MNGLMGSKFSKFLRTYTLPLTAERFSQPCGLGRLHQKHHSYQNCVTVRAHSGAEPLVGLGIDLMFCVVQQDSAVT